MSFGSSQGTVRYAVMMDTAQAERGISTLRTQMTSLNTPTTTLGKNVATLNQQFTAGVKPLGAQGSALTNNSKFLAENVKQTKLSIGALKDHVLGMGVAVAGAVGLATSFNDLTGAQIKNDKAQVAAAASANKVGDLQRKLAAAVKKFGENSKEAAAIQADLKIAMERAKVAGERAAFTQDKLGDTYANFAANIMPQSILAVTGFTDVLQGMGVKASSITGLFSKLGGAVTGGIASIGSGLGGLTDKLKLTGGAATGLKGSLLGLGVTVGVIGAVTAGAIELGIAMNKVASQFSRVKEPVSALEAGIDKTGKSLKIFNLTVAETEAAARAGVSPMIVAFDAVFGTKMTQKILQNAGALDKEGKIMVDFGKNTTTTVAPSKELATAQDALNKAMNDPALTSHVTNTAKAAKLTLAHAQAEVDRVKALEKTNVTLGKSNTLSQEELNILGRAKEAKQQQIDWQIKLAGAYTEVILKTTAAANNAEREALSIKLEDDAMKNILPKIVKMGEAHATAADQIKLVGDMVKLTKDKTVEWNSVIDPVSSALKDLTKITIDVTAATVAGITKFGSFIKTTAEGAITNKQYHDSLLATVGAQVKLPPALDLTTSQLESVQQALANAKVGLTENSNAAGILADALDQQLAPSIQKLGGALTALNSKEFKKAFKDLDFGAAGKKFKSFASDLDKDISQINKEAGRMETIFSQLSVALSINKLPHKQWIAGLEGMRKEIEKIGHIQKIDLSGITTFIAKAESIKDPVQLAKYQKVIALITEKSKGGFNPTELVEIATAIEQTGESSGKAAPKLDAAQQALVKFGKEASATVTITAQMSASMVTSVGTAVDFITKTLGGIASIQVPTPNEKNYQKGLQLAINNAAQTVKFIKKELDKISGIKVPAPNEKTYQKGLQLAINNAAQTVKLIGKELGKIGSIKVPAPKFNNFNSALDQAVSDAKRAVRDINNALTKVKKPSSGGGNGSGPGATTGPFNSDSSKSDSGGGGGSGDTVINIHVMDETIMRRITARSGRGRFTMGA